MQQTVVVLLEQWAEKVALSEDEARGSWTKDALPMRPAFPSRWRAGVLFPKDRGRSMERNIDCITAISICSPTDVLKTYKNPRCHVEALCKLPDQVNEAQK